MAILLDNQRIFGDDCPVITVESLRRSFIESSAAGLDGVVSIDLGSRGRKLRQAGHLRAKSTAELAAIIASIENFLDGKTHSLASSDDGTYENLRLESFKIVRRSCEGAGVGADYEICYTQLV
jgi:hypothetical protein